MIGIEASRWDTIKPIGSMPLFPELAQLEYLVELRLARFSHALVPSVPTDWLLPGAFPRLTW